MLFFATWGGLFRRPERTASTGVYSGSVSLIFRKSWIALNVMYVLTGVSRSGRRWRYRGFFDGTSLSPSLTSRGCADRSARSGRAAFLPLRRFPKNPRWWS